MTIYAVLVLMILKASESASSVPTWSESSLMNAGQHKVVNNVQTAPSTFQISSSFHTAFSAVPRVVLGFQGYQQDPSDSSTTVGFMIDMYQVTQSDMYNNATIYGANLTYLIYTYMGVSYDATDYYISYESLQFSNSNVSVGSSSSRAETFLLPNQMGEVWTDYQTNEVVMQGYLSGFQLLQASSGTYIALTISLYNSTHHQLHISTKHDVQIYQIGYYRFSFDRTTIMQTYTHIIDLGFYQGFDSVQSSYNSTLTADSFKYRNFLMGFTTLQIANPATEKNILLKLLGSLDTIYDVSYGSATYEQVYALIFHHRVRSCDDSEPYYLHSVQKCYDVCPDYYFSNPDGQFCDDCFYGCIQCQSSDSDNCTSCSSDDFRTLINNSCPCNLGYFDHGQATCALCDSTCLTCQLSISNCTSCNQSDYRQLIDTQCVCYEGYYDRDGQCSLCHYSCSLCDSDSDCSTCDSDKYRQPDNGICECMEGYYDVGVQQCQSCHVNCLTCQEQSNNCVSCNTQFRQLNGNDCECKQGLEDNGDGTCGSQCGDGIISRGEDCDDHNTANQDGCSSACQVENGHKCESRDNGASLCYYSATITMQIQSITKEPTSNRISLTISITANNINGNFFKEYLEKLKAVEIHQTTRLLADNLVIQVHHAAYDIDSGVLSLVLEYYQTISSLSHRKLTFVSSHDTTNNYLSYFYATPQATVHLEEPHNHLPITFYTQDQYNSVTALTIVFFAMIGFCVLFSVVAVVGRRTAIALESCLIICTSYMLLLGLSEVSIGMSGLGVAGKYILGYNIPITSSLSDCTMHTISLACNSLDNFNITYCLVMTAIIIAFALSIFRKCKQSQPLTHSPQPEGLSSSSSRTSQVTKVSDAPYTFNHPVQVLFQICHEGSTLGLMLLVIFYWATICLQNEVELGASIGWDVVLMIGMLGMGWLWWRAKEQRHFSYWAILQTGLETLSFRTLYYPIYFIYLTLLGILIPLTSLYVVCPFIILYSIFLIVIIHLKNIYNHPFNKYRAIFNQFIILIISIIFLLAQAIPDVIGTGIPASAVLVTILIIQILINASVWTYILYFDFKNQEKSKRYEMSEVEQSKDIKKMTQKEVQFNYTSRKVPLLETVNKAIVRQQVSELKTFRENLRMTDRKNLSDEEAAKISFSLIEALANPQLFDTQTPEI